MPSIRPAGLGDAPRLALAAQASFLETFAGLLGGSDIVARCEEQLGVAAHERWLADPDARLWLAEMEEGGAPVGYALLARPDLPVATDEADLELKRIYLLSRFHGAGAGQALMEAAIAEAGRRGARRLLLGVYAGNRRARAFYVRQGFSQVGERRFQVGGNAYEDIIFALDLKEAR